MINWGFLGTLFSSWRLPSFIKGNGFLKYRYRRNLFRFLMSLLAFLVSSYFLKKIFEVPVYVTRIDALTHNCVLDPQKGVNIAVFRNYDREDKNSLVHDEMWESYNKESHLSGGFFVSGLAKTMRGKGNADEKRVRLLENKLDSLYHNYHYTPIDDPNILYVSLMTSRRQVFEPAPMTTKDYIDTFTNKRVVYTYYNGAEELNDSCDYTRCIDFRHLGSMPDGNSHIMENIIASSKTDSTMTFASEIKTLANGTPTILVAEDVSKLVEVIYVSPKAAALNDSSGLWSAVKSLTFNYMGCAEFSEHIIPEPDETTVSSIKYTTREKIQEIGRNGLRFHVKFPDMENMQEARIFILSAIVTALGALLLRYFWRITNDIYKSIQHKLRVRKRARTIINIVKWAVIIYMVYTILLGIYYSNVHPYDMYNYLVD